MSGPIGMKPIDLDTIWDELRLGMDHIYFQNQKPMTRKEYIALYTWVQTFRCSNNQVFSFHFFFQIKVKSEYSER